MDECGIDVQVLSLSAPGVEQLDPSVGDSFGEERQRHALGSDETIPGKDHGLCSPRSERSPRCGRESWRDAPGTSVFADGTLIPTMETPISTTPAIGRFSGKQRRSVSPSIYTLLSPLISQVTGYGFALAGAPFGFGLETALCVMRLIYSGALDEFPTLKIILGHLGEALPFLIKRIDWAWERPFDPNLRPKIAKKDRASISKTTSSIPLAETATSPHSCVLGRLWASTRFSSALTILTKIRKNASISSMGYPYRRRTREKVYSANARRFGLF